MGEVGKTVLRHYLRLIQLPLHLIGNWRKQNLVFLDHVAGLPLRRHDKSAQKKKLFARTRVLQLDLIPGPGQVFLQALG